MRLILNSKRDIAVNADIVSSFYVEDIHGFCGEEEQYKFLVCADDNELSCHVTRESALKELYNIVKILAAFEKYENMVYESRNSEN